MKTKEYYFDLPQELIAQIPLEKRDASRMLMVSKETGEIAHLSFYQITEQLKEGDVLVLNNSRVLPARIYGKKSGTGGKIEVLLLERQEKDSWKCLVKPGKKMKVGSVVEFDENFSGEVIRILEDGVRLIRFSYSGIFEERLDALGEMPLPPYIHEQLSDRERYQTVYSKEDGSAAAPTAGLHFTESLLEELRKKNIQIAYVTLHVGLGTFRPVQVEDVLEHKMHSEFYTVDEKNAEIISQAKKDGRRVIAVGTTSTRTLESIYQKHKEVVASSGWTDIFIYPGYQFGVIDGLVTNFHLPESTLIMLVSAFLGKENTMNAYQTAVKEKYRFFSFGDAMFII